ncbi:MAG TPA: toll/interleukin-1 receptor domain-containing protein [Planctomycetota bacterium]|nr:toll/interleukin-1 receptor domain-containing protein [Planctomycetota bacterium]
MVTAFLSYSHLDAEFVRKLAADLRAAGVEVWEYESDGTLGTVIREQVVEAIRGADYLAACLSPNSVRSIWVAFEIGVAHTPTGNSRACRVVPILLPGCRDEEIPSFLHGVCYADFRDEGRYGGVLARLLKHLAQGAESALPRLKVLAAETAEQLVGAAKWPSCRQRVVDYIVEELPTRTDPTERHWAYIALGRIGGKKAKRAIEQGLSDLDEFARLGAQTAWEMLR